MWYDPDEWTAVLLSAFGLHSLLATVTSCASVVELRRNKKVGSIIYYRITTNTKYLFHLVLVSSRVGASSIPGHISIRVTSQYNLPSSAKRYGSVARRQDLNRANTGTVD